QRYLSVTGTAAGSAALAALGISDEGRSALASPYSAGASLWRPPIVHFVDPDLNWCSGLSDGAEGSDQNPDDNHNPDDQCASSGSIIECQSQILAEQVAVAGTPFVLRYQSDRTPGRKLAYTIDIPVTGATVPPPLQRVALDIQVAGRDFQQPFPNAA